MKSRLLLSLTAAAALVAPLLMAGAASAQERYREDMRLHDEPRFRGGIGLEGGAMLAPGVVSLGTIGVTSQLGVQINHEWAVYAAPAVDVVVGSLGGLNLTAAVLADWTYHSLFSVGAGLDTGVFAAFGGSSKTVSGAGGALYGARLHFAYYPILVLHENRIRRKALFLAADLRILGGGAAFGASTGNGTTVGSASSFALVPVVSIGYQAF